MSVTDGDRAEARALWGHCMDHEGERGAVELIAQALAAERERARAPFLALAEELAKRTEGYGSDESKYDTGYWDATVNVAVSIRRAAEERQ